ncbi:MAG: MASE3 domain-containing protein [Sedimentisphaerales bacterium]|jgi:signal transduction histidine kinase
MVHRLKKHYWSILFCVAVLVGLWVASEASYLVFHSIAEVFSVVVACGIFVVAWNSRRFAQNSYLLFVGIAYLFVAGLDLLHTLAYKGMGVFHGYEPNLAAQLWISGRYVESVSLLIAAFMIGRKVRVHVILAAYGVVTAFLLVSIFHWKIFPACFVEATGLTPFKKVSEYIICLLLVLSIAMLLRRRDEFEPHVLWLLVGSIAVTMTSELVFTLYTDVEGPLNLIGHYLKIISFYLMYRAIIQTGLTRPFDLLLRDLKHSEEALKAAKENLEIEVSERTAQLQRSVEKLRETITQRRQAEVNLSESREALRLLAGRLLSVQEQERRRLARELHDDLTQRLAVLAIEAGKLERQLESSPSEIREKLGQMKHQMVRLSSDVHDISRQLHPSIIDDLGLSQAIQSECINFAKREGIAVKYEPKDIPPKIPRDTSVCLFRIVQEGLRNIAKHAKVAEAQVRLVGNDDTITLTIEDAGVGFDPAKVRGEAGLGLVSMQERTRLIQGRFLMQSEPGRGTVIRVTTGLSGD